MTTITEVQPSRQLTVDWNNFTWGDLLAIQSADSDEARSQAMGDLITKLTGEDLNALPALQVVEVTKLITERLGLSLNGAEAKN